MNSEAINTETFRDHIATINESGNRAWIYAKKTKGRYHRFKTWFGIFLLTLLFVFPFIKLNGHPFMLLNFIERKFIIFGVAFWPQDFILFVLAMMTFLVFIILFTVIFGRIWCGFACPQTIFMEVIFRRIEFWIEGDSKEQKRLDNAPWDTDKIIKKVSKHLVFFIISLIITNTFLAYIIGIDQLKSVVTESPSKHLAGFLGMLAFAGVFDLVYARFREQACIVVCPYGRLQGVLLDKHTMIVAYDYVRGEPRGKIRKNLERTTGDCIDCNLCVESCSTGIDIRNGSQLECLNCFSCVDACDAVMDKIGQKRGLIRFASEASIANKEKFKFTPRIIGYSIVLFVLLTTVSILLASRSDVETTLLRTRGQMYQTLPDNKTSNLYTMQIINKTFNNIPIELKLKEPQGEIKFVGKEFNILGKEEMTEGEFFVILPNSEITKIKTPIVIDVMSGGKVINQVKSSFLGSNM